MKITKKERIASLKEQNKNLRGWNTHHREEGKKKDERIAYLEARVKHLEAELENTKPFEKYLAEITEAAGTKGFTPLSRRAEAGARLHQMVKNDPRLTEAQRRHLQERVYVDLLDFAAGVTNG